MSIKGGYTLEKEINNGALVFLFISGDSRN
jgi:hypothetical protein